MTPLLVSMTTTNSYDNADKRTRGLGHFTTLCVCAARWELTYYEGKCTLHLINLLCLHFPGECGWVSKG